MMKIQFLGTGAADWDWTHFSPGTRGCTSTLLDDHILLDAGSVGWENLMRNHADPAKITDLLVTHSHSDHFHLETVRKIVSASGKLTVRTSSQTAEKLRTIQDARLEIIELHAGDHFRLDDSEITVLPSNHAVDDPHEETFHFLFETPSKRWLYALDGAWMLACARLLLTGKTLDLIVWDATSGNHYNDWRFAEHNDLNMIDSMRAALNSLKIINGSTLHVFDHIARTLWPDSHGERLRLAEQHHGILAEDGMILKWSVREINHRCC